MLKNVLTVSAALSLSLLSGCAQESVGGAFSSSDEASITRFEPPENQPKQRDYSAMMSKMEELGRVGSHHAILNSFVGNWECKVKFWCPMQSEPLESTGTMNVKQLHDGRFVQADYKGTMSMPGADGKTKETPFTGTMLWGYSNADNEYQSVWTDNMSTAITWMTGRAEPESDTVTLKGDCMGPDENGKIIKHTNTEKIRKVSSDKYISEFWSEEGGSPKHKTMEITYTRLSGGLDAK